MRRKTSITLPTDVLAEVDRLAGSETSRSAFIERVLRSYLRRRARSVTSARELERLNRGAAALNAEAADVLGYQAGWASEEGGL
ncbi:MAG: ribbon-helix-helix protein, CopG family [Gemmatimonadetes bacterium]|jgi:metal-responsive CopG/Arc/MetJ family transcriptional regulator|nr:ribbon-helix-helix protein, CopG family [Gemmatimonadota bacterium]